MNRKILWLSGLLALALTPWTEAMAAAYWIRLKDANGAIISGVVAGFSYNKTPVATQGSCVDGGQIPGTNVTIPANALGTHPDLFFNNGIPNVLICRTQSNKPISGQNVPSGTSQCLDNATNVAGLSQSITTKAGDYTITFNSTPANILDSNGCTASDEPTYNRTYTLTGPGIGGNDITIPGSVTNAYWVVNQVHANPEPGSLALLIAGLTGMGLLFGSRRHAVL